ncbi:MAG: L,D-transpeptidase family protein [Acidobacteria bacterium]|nr:L,D-transpeptidase family protein [Acidobacteriota bacterium]
MSDLHAQEKNDPLSPREVEQRGRPRSVKARRLTAKDHRAAEQRLAELGYWTGRIDGQWDTASHHALIAFQKVEGLKRTGRLTASVFEVLQNANRPEALESGPPHIEVDLARQVLFIVDDTGTVTRILPVSTGSGKPFKSEGWVRDAITHPGRYRVFNKIPGWKKSPLGLMYYPTYFMWGTAIHGYNSVPVKPASHGCIRIPMFAAKEFYRDTPMGIPVIVYIGLSETTEQTEINRTKGR